MRTLYLLLLLLPYTLAFANTTPVVNPQVEAVIRPYVDDGSFAGVVYLQEQGVVTHHQAYGLAVREFGVPNALDSVFRVGSISKQFLAAQVLRLRDENKLSLEDGLAKHLEISAAWQPVQLKHLLSHTSGLPLNFPVIGDAKKAPAYHTPQELLESVRDVSLSFVPGAKFQYSNVGYTLLAMVVQKVTGEDYGDHVQRVLNEQLGLKQTSLDHDALITPHLAQGYNHGPATDTRNCCFDLLNLIGAGDIRSNVLDLSRWLDLLLGDEFLSRATREELWTPRIAIGGELSYAYGWMVERSRGHLRISHDGIVPGYTAEVALWPEENKRVIVLSNVRNLVWNKDRTQPLPYPIPSAIRRQLEPLLFPAPAAAR